MKILIDRVYSYVDGIDVHDTAHKDLLKCLCDLCTIEFRYIGREMGFPVERVIRKRYISPSNRYAFPSGWLPTILETLNLETIDQRTQPLNIDLGLKTNADRLKLRTYQADAVDCCIQNGCGVIAHPTGSGKTLVMIDLVRRLRVPTLVIVPKLDLLYRTHKRFLEVLPEIGIIGEGNFEPGIWVTVATPQTLWVRREQSEVKRFLNGMQCLIMDECFPAGTMVDTPDGKRSIETLREGDQVFNASGIGVVRSVFSRSSNHLVRIYLSNGRRIVCTANHPFFTERGWVKASDLKGRFLFDRSYVSIMGKILWGEPQSAFSKDEGLEKSIQTRPIRVERVEILECRDTERSCGYSEKDTEVFNIEVSGHPSYYAEGVLVHNCHHCSIREVALGYKWVRNKQTGSPTVIKEKSYDVNTWWILASMCPAYYRFGFTATPGESDSPERRMLEAMTGPVIHQVTAKELADSGYLAEPEITMYASTMPFQEEWRDAVSENIIHNAARNRLIRSIVEDELDLNRRVLVVVDRVEHGKKLWRMIRGSDFVWGKTSGYAREEALQALRASGCVIGTVFDEGSDIPELDTIVLVSAGKAARRLIQRVGRVLRPAKGKEARVIDFVDRDGRSPRSGRPGILWRQALTRKKVYESMGYRVTIESAPAQVHKAEPKEEPKWKSFGLVGRRKYVS